MSKHLLFSKRKIIKTLVGYQVFIISMGWGKKDVTPLLTHWSDVFLALIHRYVKPKSGFGSLVWEWWRVYCKTHHYHIERHLTPLTKRHLTQPAKKHPMQPAKRSLPTLLGGRIAQPPIDNPKYPPTVRLPARKRMPHTPHPNGIWRATGSHKKWQKIGHYKLI